MSRRQRGIVPETARQHPLSAAASDDELLAALTQMLGHPLGPQSRVLRGGAAASRSQEWHPGQYDPRPAKDAGKSAELTLPMPCGGKMVFRRIDVGGGGPLGEQRIELGSDSEVDAPEDHRRILL